MPPQMHLAVIPAGPGTSTGSGSASPGKPSGSGGLLVPGASGGGGKPKGDTAGAWQGNHPHTSGDRDPAPSPSFQDINGDRRHSFNSFTASPYAGGRHSAMPDDEKERGMKRHRRSLVRAYIQRTPWYHSKAAVYIRHWLHGRVCASLMVVALLLALFLPDLWVLWGVNNNVAIDSVLFIVMLLFIIEFCLLCAVDVSYLLSFFFFMDIIGTISMLLDISWYWGADITQMRLSGAGDASSTLFGGSVTRAARTARVGARAGRLSRVLRVLRFLPFLAHKRAEKSAGMAKAISGQLANLLATRVACLTILLVMVIPLFDLLSFPQYDYSLKTWVERLSSDLVAGRLAEADTKLAKMVSFYKDQNYGPYTACIGYPASGDRFHCTSTLKNWSPLRGSPPRGASALLVHTDTFMVGFNFYSPDQTEAILAICNIAFIMAIMVFSGAALSSVVTALAVAPLDSMLDTVRKIATTVFRFSAANAENGEEEETYDIDSSSEMKLLERVVQKLAIIADLQMSAADKMNTDNMEEEDIGVLNMMEGQNLLERKAKQDRRSMAPVRKKAAVAAIKLDDFGVSQEVYNSYAFNTMALSKPQKISLATFTVVHFHQGGEGYVNGHEEEQTLSRFVNAVEAQYLPNPFHNFAHAVDVLHYTAKLMRSMSSEAFLTDLEQFALLIAAIGHDIGHPGVNNGFLAEVGHDLALQYNDRAPLENMHCSKLYSVSIVSETNVFASLKREQYQEARHCIIESILHTDMMVHQAMVKDLQMCFEMNSEVFERRNDPNTQNVAQLAETELFNKEENKLLALECILHSADVSNPCRTWETTQAWAWCVLEEFFAQGDQEKMLGVPVQFLNDRDKLNRPNSQIGFLEFMIGPFYVAQIRLWPTLFELGDHLGYNIGQWEQMWVKETSPDDESKAKVRARVQKVVANLEEAKSCGAAASTER